METINYSHSTDVCCCSLFKSLWVRCIISPCGHNLRRLSSRIVLSPKTMPLEGHKKNMIFDLQPNYRFKYFCEMGEVCTRILIMGINGKVFFFCEDMQRQTRKEKKGLRGHEGARRSDPSCEQWKTPSTGFGIMGLSDPFLPRSLLEFRLWFQVPFSFFKWFFYSLPSDWRILLH